jgi:5-methylcytosine-specific restriction protein A
MAGSSKTMFGSKYLEAKLMTRSFRNPESYKAEEVTRSKIEPFLEERGFYVESNDRERHGQTIIATDTDGTRMTMRVRLCWNRESEIRDQNRTKTYAAAQIVGKIKNNDWEGTIQDKIEREKAHSVTHLLFVQREGEHIVYAGLVPLAELLAIWSKQREVYQNLINAGQLGGIKKNPAQNGSSPTLYLQNDRAPQVEDALWKHPGVFDLAKLPPSKLSRLARLSDEEADQSGSGSYIPQAGAQRQVIETQIKERRGQQAFRQALSERYGNRCLVTCCEVLAVLEAAHIKPYRGENDNHPENGLLLRSDIHTLFDLDLMAVEPNGLHVELHPSIEKEYGHLSGKVLACRNDRRPSLEALKERYKEFKKRLKYYK